MQEASHRVVSHVKAVAEHEVRHRATLDAHIVELERLKQSRSPSDVEAVTDPLGSAKNCIINLLAILTIALSSVHVAVERVASVDCLRLGLIDLRQELFDRPRKVLLLDHVEAGNQVRADLLALKHSIDLALDMAFGHLERL